MIHDQEKWFYEQIDKLKTEHTFLNQWVDTIKKYGLEYEVIELTYSWEATNSFLNALSAAMFEWDI